MINHEFVWNDNEKDDASDPECRDCEGLYSQHVAVEGITNEDELYESWNINDISSRYYINPKDQDW